MHPATEPSTMNLMQEDQDSKRERMNKSSDRGWLALCELDFELAEKSYMEAVAEACKLKDLPAEAILSSYLAVVKRATGRGTEARQLLERSLGIAEELQEKRIVAHVLFLLSELDTDNGDEAQAIAGLWKALDIAFEAGDSGTAEASFGKLGEIYRNRGWLEQSSECFHQAFSIAPDSPNAVAWLGNYGQTLAEMGDLSGAINNYKKAIELAEKHGDLKSQSRCLASEGLAYFEDGKYEKALPCFESALELAKSSEDLPAQAAWLGNIGNAFLQLGQLPKAKELCREALELARRSGDKRLEAAQLDSIGDCLYKEGDYSQSLEHYRQAQEAASLVNDCLGQRVYLANQGRALERLGQDDEALAKLAQAVDLFDEQRGRIQSDNLKTLFAASGQDLYPGIIELCLRTGRRVEAVEYVGRAKSRAMLDLLSNSPIDIADLQSSNDQAIAQLIAKEIELRSQISSLERMFGQSPLKDSGGGSRSGAADVNDVPELYKEWRTVVDQLKRRHPGYAGMVSVDAVNFAEIGKLWGEYGCLSPSSAIFEFFWNDSFLMTAAIWQGAGEPEIRILRGVELAEAESDLIDFLEMSTTEGWEVPQSLCSRLYKRIFGDLVSRLPENIQRLILVPHGCLHKLPFAALYDGERYLIEKYALSVVPSASLVRLLAENQRPTREKTRYLVSAISDYSATRNDGIAFSARLRSSSGLEDLSYTLEEGKTVYGLVSTETGAAELLTNAEVKDGLLNKFRDYSVIHFAGHAIFNPEEPLASGLVLADGSVLTAARILEDSRFRTDCGRLLVLSACQTGVNVVTGGGEIIGLARALIYAGMRNLLSSLWEVADRSTSQLMQDFHSAWQGGKVSIASALREAQCKALKEGQPVHAWAPFIHMGID